MLESKRSKPRFQTIIDQLKLDLQARRYGSGERMPTDKELAARFDTSRLTVIRALRDLEAEGLVTRKAGSGTFVRASTPSPSLVFGLLMPDLVDGEIFEPISRSIVQTGESLHHTVLWGGSTGLGTAGHGTAAPEEVHGESKEQLAEDLCRYFISRKVSGVFFCPVEHTRHQHEVNARTVAELEAAGIPLVLIDRCIYGAPDRCAHDLVGIDNHRAGYLVTRHLLRAGCRRLVFAYRPGAAPPVQARFAGYRDALWAEGMDPETVRGLQYEGTDLDQLESFLQAARPDGIVCANDLTAASLMHDLLRLGVRIPQEVRMVGINDVKYASFLPVPLTTLRQPCQQIGSMAMSVMLDRLQHPGGPIRDVLVDCELVVRVSCGTALASATTQP